MARRFDSFVMFAGMRTGSNFLEANLNALPGVACHGELFNPHFIGRKDVHEFRGISIAARDADPLPLLAGLRSDAGQLQGFRFFHDHDPRVLAAVLPDPGCAKIILTRNALESYVSLKIAQATGQWKVSNPKSIRAALARFDAAEFEAHLEAQHAFQRMLLRGLQTTGQAAFCLDYAEIGDVEVLNGLASFLGLKARLEAPDSTLKKQNPESLWDKVENPEEMAEALARIDWFDLTGVPVFEPRRSPGVGQVLAAAGAPLLFLPVRGGPDGLAEWLGAVGGAGLLRGFDHKALRQWKRRHPGFRSFTVVRHPVRRAWEVLVHEVLGGRMPEMAEALRRQLGQPLPAPDDIAGLRAALLVFLGLVKRGLAGQSHLKVAAGWASQTAALQGFAQLHLPDHILREDDLPAGLARLAAEIGQPCPAFEAASVPVALTAVYDASVEAAAREAYQRDYVGLGFGPFA